MYQKRTERAFTRLELLISLFILLILSVLFLLLINPKDKLALTRDTGRVMNIATLGRAVVVYNVGFDGQFPQPPTWLEEIVTFANLPKTPTGIRYTYFGVVSCQKNEKPASVPTYCYDLDEDIKKGAIVYARMESWTNNKRCISGGEQTYFVYSTAEGKAGFVCAKEEPSPWEPGSKEYVD